MNPERIYRVSRGQLSIARYYGGIVFNGDHYLYDPTEDTLTRADMVKGEAKKKRDEERERREWAKAAQGELLL